VVTSHLRFAAVCVLAAGLLMGGGAVAVADPDSSGSAAKGTDSNQQHSTGAKKPKKDPGGTDTNQRSSTGATSPNQEPGDTDTNQHPSTGATSPNQEPGVTDTNQRSSTGATSPNQDPGDTDTNNEKKDSALVAAVPNVLPLAADVAAPVPDVAAPVPDVVAPVADVAAPVADVVAPVADVVASVPNLVAPTSDVIAFLRDVLTAGASAVVPLTQLQSDLFSWFSSLFGIAGAQPVVVGLGGAAGAGLPAAADASVASQLPRVRAFAGIPGVPLAGNATGVATHEGIAASTFGATTQAVRASPLPGMAPPAPNGASPTGEQPFFRDACELLLHASLWALAAAALPGAGGLAILTAAGVRIGYRQAKAGFVVRAAGIARFTGPGPLGVVRSGSSVVVRPRASRVVRPGAVSAGCLLDEVA
jgi:hypothetical protein